MRGVINEQMRHERSAKEFEQRWIRTLYDGKWHGSIVARLCLIRNKMRANDKNTESYNIEVDVADCGSYALISGCCGLHTEQHHDDVNPVNVFDYHFPNSTPRRIQCDAKLSRRPDTKQLKYHIKMRKIALKSKLQTKRIYSTFISNSFAFYFELWCEFGGRKYFKIECASFRFHIHSFVSILNSFGGCLAWYTHQRLRMNILTSHCHIFDVMQSCCRRCQTSEHPKNICVRNV